MLRRSVFPTRSAVTSALLPGTTAPSASGRTISGVKEFFAKATSSIRAEKEGIQKGEQCWNGDIEPESLEEPDRLVHGLRKGDLPPAEMLQDILETPGELVHYPKV